MNGYDELGASTFEVSSTFAVNRVLVTLAGTTRSNLFSMLSMR